MCSQITLLVPLTIPNFDSYKRSTRNPHCHPSLRTAAAPFSPPPRDRQRSLHTLTFANHQQPSPRQPPLKHNKPPTHKLAPAQHKNGLLVNGWRNYDVMRKKHYETVKLQKPDEREKRESRKS